MSVNYIMPAADDVKSLLAIIFGEEVGVDSCDTPAFDGDYVATFIDREDKLVALCYSDIDFVAYSGSALSMIPAGAAEDMIADKDISESIAGNFHEVMNICSQLLMSDDTPHLRLDRTLPPSADGAGELGVDPVVASLKVEVPRYGQGRLSFVVT